MCHGAESYPLSQLRLPHAQPNTYGNFSPPRKKMSLLDGCDNVKFIKRLPFKRLVSIMSIYTLLAPD